MNELHLFAGVGGGIYGGQLLGHRCICAVEIVEYRRQVLLQRQRDGVFPRFPIWDDIQTFDGRPWRGTVNIVSGGFPCQDISVAGRGKGLEGKRSGLWSEMARVVREVKPGYVFVENSPRLTGLGLDRVLMDLASIGYDAEWCVLGADDVGAPHRRKRIWILAYSRQKRSTQRNTESFQENKAKRSSCMLYDKPSGIRSDNVSNTDEKRKLQQKRFVEKVWGRPDNQGKKDVSNSNETRLEGLSRNENIRDKSRRDRTQPNGSITSSNLQWWETDPADNETESRLGRMAHGVANWRERIEAIGDGQVPAVAATAWNTLMNRINS